MALVIHLNGYKITCDRADEAAELVARISNGGHHGVPPTDVGGNNEVAALAGTLTKTQRSFLRFVATAGEISDSEARESLHLVDNKQLAGILAAIHRGFKKAGLPYPVRMEKRFRGGARSYRYTLSEADAAALKGISVE